MVPSRDIAGLLTIMARLRDPDGGCPWDLDQDFASIRHYTIEEAYEVADAIERGDYADLCEELGDLLLQSVFHAQMASERGLFDFGDVVEAITKKLIRRHPHVFGDTDAASAAAVKTTWDAIKAEERLGKAEAKGHDSSILDDVPIGLPALMRAEKLSKRAASVGFDWPEWRETLAKVSEELTEVEAAASAGDPADIRAELGDLLFAVANLSRKLGVEPEAALRDGNQKFARRFAHVEARAKADDVPLADAGLARLDGYWNEIRATDQLKP